MEDLASAPSTLLQPACIKESLVSVVRVSLGILRLLYIPRTLSVNGCLFIEKII